MTRFLFAILICARVFSSTHGIETPQSQTSISQHEKKLAFDRSGSYILDDAAPGVIRQLVTRDNKVARAISYLKTNARTCGSITQEKMNCFGSDEDGMYGLAACNPKSVYHNGEVCFARAFGLKACLDEDIIVNCDLQSRFDLLMTQVNISLPVPSSGDETIYELPEEDPILIEYALDDSTFSMYLAREADMTKAAFQAQIDDIMSESMGNATNPYGSGLFDDKSLQALAECEVDPHGRRLLLPFVWGYIAAAVLSYLTTLAGELAVIFLHDNPAREAFTKEAVERCHPDFSCVIINSGLAHSVQGNQEDYERVPYDFSARGIPGQNIYGYYMYIIQNSKPFILTRHGDGGYINWAFKGYFNYNGNVLATQNWFLGARLFEHANYGGWVKYLPLVPAGQIEHFGQANLGFPNDQVSSLIVDEGCCVIIYENDWFTGQLQRFCSQSVSDLNSHGWNDRVSSALMIPAPLPLTTTTSTTTTTSIGRSSLGDWVVCSDSKYCANQCCSGKYSGGVLKCTPVGGFKPTSEGCIGTTDYSTKLSDWEICSNSNQCINQCCSGKYSSNVLKCTPVGGFKTWEGCTGSATRHLRGNEPDQTVAENEKAIVLHVEN